MPNLDWKYHVKNEQPLISCALKSAQVWVIDYHTVGIHVLSSPINRWRSVLGLFADDDPLLCQFWPALKSSSDAFNYSCAAGVWHKTARHTSVGRGLANSSMLY